jgi:hypothetical protein
MEVRSVVALIPRPSGGSVEDLDERLIVATGGILQAEEDPRDHGDSGRAVTGDQLDVPALEEPRSLVGSVIAIGMQGGAQRGDGAPGEGERRAEMHNRGYPARPQYGSRRPGVSGGSNKIRTKQPQPGRLRRNRVEKDHLDDVGLS